MPHGPDRPLYQILFTLFFLFFSVLIGCSERNSTDVPEKAEVVFYNWKDFTDLSILKDFEKETGIKVKLVEYETRDMCIAQLQTTPGLCDVLLLDTYNIPYLKKQKLVREFDSEKIPNLKFVNEKVKKRLAAENVFMPPYLTGANGFVINTNHVPADTDSWQVFGDSKYRNKIMLLDDLREGISVVLKMSNLSINEKNPANFEKLHQDALKLKQNGVIFGETFTNIDKVLKGDIWIAQTYNGDVVYKAKDRKDLKFIFPKEGFLKWIVTFALHSDSKNIEAAHKFVDYMLRPEISARSATTFSYQAPIDGAEKFMPAELGTNKIIHPGESVLARGEMARDLGESTAQYQKIFNIMKQ